MGYVFRANESIVRLLTSAVAAAEGFGVPNAIPTKANNPCDLTDDGDVGFGWFVSADGAKITRYGTADDGWYAGFKKFDRMLSGRSTVYPQTLTLREVGIRYANGATVWTDNVVAYLQNAGLPVTHDTTLVELNGMEV